jgi:hypothetical protein
MPAASARGARRIRTWSFLGVVLLVAALMLASCPDLRDGTAGQLAKAEQDTESAARSGALALEVWDERRATAALTAVVLSDARDEVLKAYRTTTQVALDDPADLRRHQFLTRSMTEVIATLVTAVATVRGDVAGQPPATLRGTLLASADALAGGYR